MIERTKYEKTHDSVIVINEIIAQTYDVIDDTDISAMERNVAHIELKLADITYSEEFTAEQKEVLQEAVIAGKLWLAEHE
jgi:hypothetical protein